MVEKETGLRFLTGKNTAGRSGCARTARTSLRKWLQPWIPSSDCLCLRAHQQCRSLPLCPADEDVDGLVKEIEEEKAAAQPQRPAQQQ